MRRAAKRWALNRARRWRHGLPAREWRHDPRRSTPFRESTRPVIRWIKGDGRDDDVTRAALAQATRLFGDEVDYCVCSVDVSVARIQAVTAWASEPVAWFPVGPRANPRLARLLRAAGCHRDHFGYWWKWFPDRVRPNAPEWILDGDMVVVDRPDWFDDWKAGRDPLRVSQSDDAPPEHFGEYADLIDPERMLYSGLVSLPPGLDYLDALVDLLTRRPLAPKHDGRRTMSEQGAVAAVFSALAAVPIPSSEFPFAVAGHDELAGGRSGVGERVWGYHFGNAFRGPNPWFTRLVGERVVDGPPGRDVGRPRAAPHPRVSGVRRPRTPRL